MCLNTAGWVANRADPDQMLLSATSDLVLHCLLRPVYPNSEDKYGMWLVSLLENNMAQPRLWNKLFCNHIVLSHQRWSSWINSYHELLFNLKNSIHLSHNEKMYLLTCVPNEDSNQPALLHSMISVFVVCMKKFCIPDFPECCQRRFWSDSVNAQADLNLCWAQMYIFWCCSLFGLQWKKRAL